MKKFTVFDIEANGLTPTKIHCMAWTDSDGLHCTDDPDLMKTVLSDSHVLIGHNIQRYDVPVLERLLGVSIKTKLVDTLALSWYLYPNRVKHGLESWGETFGIEKPPILDWEGLDTEEYMYRCEEDVKINLKLWKDQFKLLQEMYPDEQDLDRLLSYIEFKMDCAKEQEENGWKLDVEKTKELLAGLLEEKAKKVEELRAIMPPVEVWQEKARPAKMYKKTGELTVAGMNWLELNNGHDIEGPVKYLKEIKPANPDSHIQVKDWLYSLGWKPTTFAYKRDKETNSLRKIPQIQQDKSKGSGLCESVKRLFLQYPKLSVLDGLSIISHRISILEGFLQNVDKHGYIKAEIGGLTNTLRFKHRILVNLPSVTDPDDVDIRGCLVAPNGYQLAGSDMASLEDRTKLHYMFEYDREYVEEMSQPDYDPHLSLALAAGAITPEETKLYKETGDLRIKGIRHTYKQGTYACQYGAKPKRISLTIGCSLAEAEKIYNAYWKKNWALVKIGESQRVDVFNRQTWLFNPVSRFWYSLRCPKDAFSTLNQGTGVFCFDTYLKHIRCNGPKILGQFHDEFIALVRLGNEERMVRHVEEAIKKTNSELKLNRELSAGVQFGPNYGTIH